MQFFLLFLLKREWIFFKKEKKAYFIFVLTVFKSKFYLRTILPGELVCSKRNISFKKAIFYKCVWVTIKNYLTQFVEEIKLVINPSFRDALG